MPCPRMQRDVHVTRSRRDYPGYLAAGPRFLRSITGCRSLTVRPDCSIRNLMASTASGKSIGKCVRLYLYQRRENAGTSRQYSLGREGILMAGLVNRRAILTRFGVKSASKIDHPVPCAALPAVRGELGCCAWKRLPRFADGGWCRESRSARLRGIWGSRATRSKGRCAGRARALSTGARANRGRS